LEARKVMQEHIGMRCLYKIMWGFQGRL